MTNDPQRPHRSTLAHAIAAVLIVLGTACIAYALAGGTVDQLAAWVEAFATLGAVIAVIVGWHQLTDARDATRAQREQAEATALDQARPYVLLSVQKSPVVFSSLDLVLENTGNGPAYEVAITIDPPLARAKEVDGETIISDARLFRRPVEMLPPHHRIRSWLDDMRDRVDVDLPDTHQVSITYHDGRGHRWEERLVLDLTVYDDLLFDEDLGTHHVAHALREIRDHLATSPLVKQARVDATIETRPEKRERLAAEQQARHEAFAQMRREQSRRKSAAESGPEPTSAGPDYPIEE